jgi:hypothetical protein
MVNVQQSPQDGWLQSDNTVLISAVAAITFATSSVLLWCCHRSILLQDTAHSPAASKVIPEEVPRDVTRQRSEQCTQGKPSRSKERRRRGKDLFKEFSKVGKRHKELPHQLNRASAASNGVSNTATSERDCPQPEKLTCEIDESPSIQISNSNSSRLGVFASNQRSTTHSSPAPSSNKSLSETANPLSVDKSCPEAEVNEEPEDQCLSSRPTKRVLSDTSPVFGEPNAFSLDPSCDSPGYLPAHSSGSSAFTEVSSSTSNTPSTRESHGKSLSRITSPWDWDGQSSFYHDLPPRFARARVVNPQRESRSPIFSPVTFSPPNTPSTLSRILSSSSIESSARSDAASPPSASRVGDQLPPMPCPPPPVSVSAQTEIASLRGALEAVRVREEKSRAEAERRAKDYDALSWRWAEERTRWHRREAEVQLVKALHRLISHADQGFSCMLRYSISLLHCRCMQARDLFHLRPFLYFQLSYHLYPVQSLQR